MSFWTHMLTSLAFMIHDANSGMHFVEITSRDMQSIESLVRNFIGFLGRKDYNQAWNMSSADIQRTFLNCTRLVTTLRKNPHLTHLLSRDARVHVGDIDFSPEGFGVRVDLSLGQGTKPQHHFLFILVQEAGVWKINGALPCTPTVAAVA